MLGGRIYGRDKIRFPGQHYEKMPILNPTRDKKILGAFSGDYSKSVFDFVSVPGIQTGKDVMEVRDALGDRSKV